MLIGCQKENGNGQATGEKKEAANEKHKVEDYGLIRIGVAQGGTQYETPQDNELVEAEINKMLLADRNAKVDLEVVYFTQAQKEQEINIKIASGERLDVIGQHWSATPGFMQPMNKYIDKYGQNIKKLIPDSAWDNVTIDGNIMAIPQLGFEYGLGGGLVVRTELMKKAGISKKPETMKEVEEMLAKYKEMGYIPLGSYRTETIITTFGGTIDGYQGSFDINSPRYIDENGNVMPEILTSANLEMTKKIRSWVEKEYIPRDYVTMNAQTLLQLIKTGKVASWVENNIGWSFQTIEPLMAVDANAKPEIVPWLGKKAKINPVSGTVCFTPTTKNFEGTIKYFDWVLSDYKNYYTAAYGINGVHRNNDFKNMTYKSIDTVEGRKNTFEGRGLVAVLNMDATFGKMMKSVADPNASEASKRVQSFYDELYNTYINWPKNKNVENPYYGSRSTITDINLNTSMAENYKIVRQRRDAYIIDGNLETYKKALDDFKKTWETQYMKVYTDAYKKDAGIKK